MLVLRMYNVGGILLNEFKGEDVKVMVGRFIEVYKRKGLKVNAKKSKAMVLGEEEGFDGARLEQLLEFLHLMRVLD